MYAHNQYSWEPQIYPHAPPANRRCANPRIGQREELRYEGTEEQLAELFRRNKKPFAVFLGTKTLYHATTRKRAAMIKKEQRMKAGRSGMYGAGIYFATSREAAAYKSQHDGRPGDVIIKADVDLGWAFVIKGPKSDLKSRDIGRFQCTSVKGKSRSGADWEYCVYDPARVTNLRRKPLQEAINL
jgi:hypothetical protein